MAPKKTVVVDVANVEWSIKQFEGLSHEELHEVERSLRAVHRNVVLLGHAAVEALDKAGCSEAKDGGAGPQCDLTEVMVMPIPDGRMH